jgi:uncharacterized protein (TIGR03663 family)
MTCARSSGFIHPESIITQRIAYMTEAPELVETPDRQPAWVRKAAEGLRKPATWIFVLIVLLALFTRLPNLATRVMSHDEVNHVYFAWLFAENGTYQHDPLSHGPLQFHLLAFVYRILGDSDFSSRLPAALAGIAAVFIVWEYRRWLGKAGALAAAVMMVFSPYMLYYSRYARNESFVVLEALITIWAVFRYLECRKPAWLYVLGGALAFHAATKETFFLYTAQLLIFIIVVFSIQMLGAAWKNPTLKRTFGAGLGLAASGFGLAVAVFLRDRTEAGEAAAPMVSSLVFIGVFFGIIGAVILITAMIRSFGKRLQSDFPMLDVLVVIGTLTLPQLAALPAQAMGWNPMDYQDPSQITRTAGIVIVLAIISAAVGLTWNPRRWLTAAGVFLLIFVPLYTTIFTHPFGLFSGLVGSLGYWLVQQGVERGSQPWFYYLFLQIPMYEYLAAFGFLIGIGIVLRRLLKREKIGGPQPAPASEDVPAAPRDLFLVHLIYWALTAVLIYTYAGERMPWLTVHIALPLILFAGWAFGTIITGADWRAILRWRTAALIVLTVLGITAIVQSASYLLGIAPSVGSVFPEIERITGWIITMGLGAASLYAAYRFAAEYRGGTVLRIAGLAVITLIFLQTIRTSLRASFVKYDSAEEFLVYAHAASGPKLALEEIEALSRHITGGPDLKIAYDNHAAYPYWWYLRRYPNAKDTGASPNRDLLNYPVVFAGEENYAKYEAFLGDRYLSQQYERLWWPLQDYFNLTWQQVWGAFTNPDMVNALWKIWFDRDYRAYAALKERDLTARGWAPASRMKMYVRQDLASAVLGMTYEGELPEDLVFTDPYSDHMIALEPDTIMGGPGADPGQFSAPRGLVVARDGIYIADSNNHRIQHLSFEGDVITYWGSYADSETGDAPDGTFNQPWDVTIGPDGSLVVADTWNHRLQWFTPGGSFLNKVGYFGTGDTIAAMWGPRSVALDDEGRVFATDAGNKRIVVFDADGLPLTTIGMGGVGPGQLDEPVGLEIGPDGRLYVADTWNQRVQVFAETLPLQFEPVLEWPVEAWYGQSLENKPDLAVSRDGHVCISDPEGPRILCFDSEGIFLSGWNTGGMVLSSGLAFDDECRLWVSDAGTNQIMRFDPGFCLESSPASE